MRTKILLSFVFFLFVTKLIDAQSPTTPDTVCMGTTEYYKILNPTIGSVFHWGIKGSGGTLSSGQNTDSINVLWANTVGKDTLWALETNNGGCTSDTVKLAVIRVAAPTAQFMASSLCYGETLEVNLTGQMPFTIVCTVNGNTQTFQNIVNSRYIVESQPGSYQLLSITDRNCKNSIFSGITSSVIAPELNTLQIIHK
jgi:hypothetical protein